MGAALSAPVINDVATNLSDLPVFSQSQHPATLSEGFKKAIMKHYPQLQPLVVPGGQPVDVFAAAKRAVTCLPRAHIVHEDAPAGALELVDVTSLMKFKDDMAIRVRQEGSDRTVVDVRSASRVGKGDLGANAARIATYLEALRKELGLQQQGSS